MIIKKIRVGHFGKLKDLEIPLHSGFNIIYGENEAGKSTLQAFIKAMFYGMNSKKKDIRENDRKRFIPWGEKYGWGEIYFEDSYKNEYMIKRKFGLKKKEDEAIILNNISGEEAYHLDFSKPGENLFGLGENAFEKTIFIRQLGAMVGRDQEDEIIKKLSNLKESGDEDISYHRAIKAIMDSKKELINQKRTGKLDRLKEYYTKLQEEYFHTKDLHDENKEDQIRYNNLVEKKYILKKEIERLEKNKENIKSFQQYREYEEIYGYLQRIESLFSERKKILEDIIKKIKENKEKLEDFKGYEDIDENTKIQMITFENENKSIKRILRDAEINIQEIDYLECTLKKEIEKDKNTKIKILGLLGIFMVLGGIIGGTFLSSYLYGLTGVGLFLWMGSTISKNKMPSQIHILKTKIEEKRVQIEKIGIDELREKLFYQEEWIKNILQRCKRNTLEEFQGGLRIYEKLIAEKKSLEKECIHLKESLNELEKNLKGMEINYIEKLQTLFNKKLEIKSMDIPNILEKVHEKMELEENDEKEVDKLLKEKHEEQISLEKEIQDVTYSIKNRFLGKKSMVEIEEELSRIKENIKYHEEVGVSMDMAVDTLRDSFKEIQRDFGPKLNQNVGNILKKITNEKYNTLKISEDYRIKVVDSINHEMKDVEYFSNGTWDQIYFALRIGIMGMIFEEKNRIPFILDDPFIQYDDRRLENVLSYLYEYSQNHQVILFTCQKREILGLQGFPEVHFIQL